MNTKQRANDDDVAIGARIRLLRMQRGMTQERLGEACGITFQQIQKYEKGTNRIGFSRLKQIATALELGVAQLIGEEGDAVDRAISLGGADRAGIADVAAMETYFDLPADARRSVRTIIDQLHDALKPRPTLLEAAE